MEPVRWQWEQKSFHSKLKNKRTEVLSSIIVVLRFLLFFAHTNKIIETRTASELANVLYHFILTKNITFLKFWVDINCWGQEQILQNCRIKLFYFIQGFQEFAFLLPRSKTYLDNSHGHLPSLLSENSLNFRHLFTGLQHFQYDCFSVIVGSPAFPDHMPS